MHLDTIYCDKEGGKLVYWLYAEGKQIYLLPSEAINMTFRKIIYLKGVK